MHAVGTRGLRLVAFLFFCLSFIGVFPARAQVKVDSANPNTAPQGTLNLSVTIGGSGFKRGAKATFYVKGTTDTGGIAVKSTSYSSSSQVTATIDVSGAATISGFDIVVTNSDGRTGKGSDLFSVTSNPNACVLAPQPAAFVSAVTVNYCLNSSTPAYTASLGTSLAGRVVKLSNGTSSRNVAVVAAGHGTAGSTVDVFFLDPDTGAVLDNTVILAGSAAQPHLSLPAGNCGTRAIAFGDFNNDGITDIAALHSFCSTAAVHLGSVSKGVLTFGTITLVPPDAGAFGQELAVGDLDQWTPLGPTDAGDEIALPENGSGSGKKALPPKVLIYKFDAASGGFSVVSTITAPQNSSGFGLGLAIGRISGSLGNDLVVGAQSATVNGQQSAGQTYFYQYPVLPTAGNPATYSPGVSNDYYGVKLSYAHDLFGSNLVVASGMASNNRRADNFLNSAPSLNALINQIKPAPGMGDGWATTAPVVGDVDGDGIADIAVGAPNAQNTSLCSQNVGITYVYLSKYQTTFQLQAPATQPDSAWYGWAAAFIPDTNLMVVGEKGRDLCGVTWAGEIYVYKVQ